MGLGVNACVSSFCCTVVSFTLKIMDYEMFSLEEDDSNELFLTQTPRQSSFGEVRSSGSERNSGLFGLPNEDFSSPCCSLVNRIRADKPVYEDISDDDQAFEKSQNDPNFE